MMLALETETANAIGYASFAAVLIVAIIAGAWVLVRWGPPRSGSIMHPISDPPTWSSETRIEFRDPPAEAEQQTQGKVDGSADAGR